MRLDAQDMTARLGGHWYYTYGVAPCPVCQSERYVDQRALTLRDGDNGHLLAHCKKSGCDYLQICTFLAFTSAPPNVLPSTPRKAAQRTAKRRNAEKSQSTAAYSLWHAAQPITGTPAERYLRTARCISGPLPETLRFCPAASHPSGQSFPAMIAQVQNVALFAVHRTYLRPDGRGKAEIEPAKAMLGSCKGGAVALTNTQSGPLVICEGIETGLSLASGLLSTPSTIWAALSTSGIRGLKLPHSPGHLIVATDGDEPGYQAGQALAQRAYALGWRVELLPAPTGTDWNDILIQRSKK
jgi:hypothetical protein